MIRTSCVLVSYAVALLAAPALASDAVQLAADGKTHFPVIVSENASDRLQLAAKTLADYLGRISRSDFEVTTGDGTHGIAVGTAQSFPTLKLLSDFDSTDINRREEYLLRSHSDGIWLIGATELAVEHAIWDLLYRLGHRQFFPGEIWEVVPTVPNLNIEVDTFERPDYLSRRIWYGYGMWDYNSEPYKQWCARNRCVPGIHLNTGHAYDRVVKDARKEFDRHPEYWPLLDGDRKPVKNPKPCLGNPAVRSLFVQYALQRLEKDPNLDSISMDPSDGGGWCECEKCAQLGSVSDQATTLANEVASAVSKQFPGKLVGIYAYNYHSPPPSVLVNSNVVVSVATAFIKGGQSLDEIITGWSAQGATLGIREYYSVNTWDRDLPARARGGRIDYLRETIPAFHASGARFMSAESSDNWGPNGLGYYLASRMLWDVDEAKQVDDLTEDFLTNCFGPAKEPMREFYQQLDGSKPHLAFDDQLGRMFRALDSAMQLLTSDKTAASDESPERIKARLNDLILYARYVDLFDRYQHAEGSARQAAFEAMIRHTYRMRQTMLVHAKALYRDVVARDKKVSIPVDATWSVAESKNPWKTSKPFSAEELNSFLREGIEQHQLLNLDFEPITYSEELVPGTSLKLTSAAPGVATRGRGNRTFYTYIEKAPAKLSLKITGGLIAHYRDRGNVRIELSKIGGESQTGERETLVASDSSVPPDGKARRVTLPVTTTGLHKLNISDGGDLTSVEWPADLPISYKSSIDEPIKTSGRWSLYFYVPRGTTVVGLYGGGSPGTILDPTGKKVFSFDDHKAGYYSIPVAAGTDGKLWKVHQAAGAVRLLTVPPYLARSASELLLPREVVQRDSE
ncbi:DUF4838 domain-containing protein [Symmachiella dynata]|uniref:DUF4838 domain-containing protein n=1 Tax=Symmachiella dynata TaxID=2527995 RepID=UPI0030EBDF33